MEGFIGEQLELKGAGRVLDVEEDDLEAIVEKLKVPVDMQVTRDPSRLARLVAVLMGNPPSSWLKSRAVASSRLRSYHRSKARLP